MSLSEQEQRALEKIEAWEESEFKSEVTDLTALYDKWIQSSLDKLSPNIRNQILKTIDQSVFHLNAALQSSHYQREAREQILTEARVFDDRIDTIEDMKRLSFSQLNYIALQQVSRQKLLAFAQGGISGTGGIMLLGVDFPLLLAINMRAIQLIAMTYGYEINLPRETMTVLKVLHVGTLPRHLKAYGWMKLKEETFNKDHDPYFYSGRDDLEGDVWFRYLIHQIVKSIFISQLKKKLVNGIPILGMALGAGLNFNLTRKTTDLAHHFYQKRFLLERRGEGDGNSYA